MLKPDKRYRTIYDIDLDELKHKGIKNILFDLDNTLVSEETEKPTEELITWLSQLEQKGFKRAIVSNNRRERVERFAKDLSIHALFEAEKPDTEKMDKALQLLEAKTEETAMVGDRLFTDVWVGKRLKLHTILVEPVGKDVTKGVKIIRKIENLLLSLQKA